MCVVFDHSVLQEILLDYSVLVGSFFFFSPQGPQLLSLSFSFVISFFSFFFHCDFSVAVTLVWAIKILFTQSSFHNKYPENLDR